MHKRIRDELRKFWDTKFVNIAIHKPASLITESQNEEFKSIAKSFASEINLSNLNEYYYLRIQLSFYNQYDL